MFKATFPAPPNLSSKSLTCIIGIGASGEILLTEPNQYLSKIRSPITNIFTLLLFF